MVVLEAHDIWKAYKSLTVLKGVDLSIQKGEVVSIVGASGAGKSTLLQLLGTLDAPDKGNITINGTNCFSLSNNALAKFRSEQIGFIFQFHNLMPEFTAFENVCLPAQIAGKPKKEIEERAKELLVLLGLESRMKHKPSQLSGGEQQRVSVVRSLINEPTIVFADEPSGNLDSKNAEELHHMFFSLRDQFQQTFVIVTHNEALASISDRRLEMVDGVIV